MAYVVDRGPRGLYIRFKDLDGVWKWHRPTPRLRTQAEGARLAIFIEERIDQGLPAVVVPDAPTLLGDLLPRWLDTLTNRNKQDDRTRTARHLLPRFRKTPIAKLTVQMILEWLDEMRAGTLSDGSQRANLNLLSRFFSWAVGRGLAQFNPVRLIPTGQRPQQAAKSDTPWIDDDAIVLKLIGKLRSPIDLMFYLGNRSGMRLGECSGLRMSDLAWLHEGTIRVRFSYDGPLKEDKRSTGKVKWVPAPDDAREVLGQWLTQRQAEGAGPEDRLFPWTNPKTRRVGCYNRVFIRRAWNAALAELKRTDKIDAGVTFYQATRHSFVSRNLSRDASLDQVSAAVGHSSPAVTKRYYDHFVRKQFSDGLKQGLGLKKGLQQGTLLPLPKTRR